MTAEALETQPDTPDLSVIIPPEARLTVDGIEVRVRRLRSREVLSLARIISAGLGDLPMEMEVDWSDKDDIKGKLVGMMLVALPLAADEALDFFRGVIVPVDQGSTETLGHHMANPDMGALLDIIDTMVDQEGPALLDLVGKAQRLAAKVGTLFSDRKPSAGPGGSGGRSPAPST